MAVQERTVAIAGLAARIRSPFGGALGGLPRPFAPFVDGGPAAAPPAAPPIVEIDLEHAPELAGRPSRPDHPRFARRRDGDVLVVDRADAEGRIDLAAEPVRARFRIPEDGYAVEACVRVALSVALPRHDALILHASAVRWGGAAHVFTGVSGAGKSTIARLLAGVPGCDRLADELLIVARDPAGAWTLHVPPFLGVDGLPHGARAPLASIDLLAQAPAHARAPLAPAAALRELLRHVVVYAAEPATTELVLALASRLVAEVPCHRLAFAPDPSVREVLGIP